MSDQRSAGEGGVCLTGMEARERGVETLALSPDPPPADYLEAMAIADRAAAERLGDYMLLSWYDRDRDFESPQHANECENPNAPPGYLVYGLHHGAKLKVDIDDGRFVFLYLPLEDE